MSAQETDVRVPPASVAPGLSEGVLGPQHPGLSWRHQAKSSVVSVLPPRVVRATTLQAWQDQDAGGRGAPPLHLPTPLSLGAESRDHDCGSLCQGVSPPMTLKSLATPQPRLSPPPRGQFCAPPGSAPVPSCLATPPHGRACNTEASHQSQALTPPRVLGCRSRC